MNKARSYKQSDLKRLFTLASNECAWPGCTRKLIAEDNLTISGKICHISAASKNGPRWDEHMTDEERRSFANLILMCDEHHQIIDNPFNVDTHTTELLKEWKKEHEAKIGRTSFEFTERHLNQLYNQLDHSFKLLEMIYDGVHDNSDKLKELTLEMRRGFNQLPIREDIKYNQDAVDSFVAYSLGRKNDWVDSKRILAFERTLAQYNASIIDKREKFIFSQGIIQSMFNISDLKELTDEWSNNYSNPQNLDHIRFIQGGIMAYSCLKQIPKVILDDLHQLRLCPIHIGFFKGHLGSFINELKSQITLKTDLVKMYQNDRYLFENLKRIIESLRSYLVFNVDDLYIQRKEAIITQQLPEQFLIVSTSSALTIRDSQDYAKVFASLPLNKLFPIEKVEVIALSDRVLVVSFTSQECFFWNPKTDITATIFHRVKGEKSISNIFTEISNNRDVLCQVQVGSQMISFSNFIEEKRHEINLYLHLTKIKGGFIGSAQNYFNSRGPVIFYLNKNFQIKPLLKIEEIQELARNHKAISEWLATEEKGVEDDNSGKFNDLRNIDILEMNDHEQNIFLIRGVMIRSGVLLIGRLVKEEAKITNIILLKDSPTITADSRKYSGSLQICCGYLDLQGSESVLELMKFINPESLESSKTIMRPRGSQLRTRDIYEICFGSNDTIYLNEEGRSLLTCLSSTGSFSEFNLGINEQISHIKYVDLTF